MRDALARTLGAILFAGIVLAAWIYLGANVIEVRR